MSNKVLLAVIAVVLIGIFGVLAIQMNEESPAEKISGNISEAIEEVNE
jgi:Flp pilus assembly protein CpaB